MNTNKDHVIKAQLELEGVAIDALLNTRSPATIISLEYLIKARLKQKPTNQSREEWEESFKETVPEVTLWGKSHKYSGTDRGDN